MNQRIFVTGAPGWLGTRFVELVSRHQAVGQKNKYDIKCLVYPGSDTEELRSFGAQIIQGDITIPSTFHGAMKDCGIVVHMTGIIHPRNVKEFYKINLNGTQNILQEAIESKVKRIIYISSNSTAGFNKHKKLFTEDAPPDPYMNYGKSKFLCEQLLLKAAQEKKIEAVILRPCWYCGPRQPARQTKFFQMIKKGKPVLFGDGSNLRSISNIDNVIQGIILAMETNGINGETFWIADEKPYTSLEIYQTIAKLLDVKELVPLRIPAVSSAIFEKIDFILQSLGVYQQEIHVAGEMSRDIACSIDKAKRMLGYSPQISLEDGMRSSIDWCRKNNIEI